MNLANTLTERCKESTSAGSTHQPIIALPNVANQFQQNFLDSAGYLLGGIGTSLGEAEDNAQLNATMRPLLLQAGISYDEQFGKLVDMQTSNYSATNITTENEYNVYIEILGVWYLRIQLLGSLNTYRVCHLDSAWSDGPVVDRIHADLYGK